jgi:hypothetical protein
MGWEADGGFGQAAYFPAVHYMLGKSNTCQYGGFIGITADA